MKKLFLMLLALLAFNVASAQDNKTKTQQPDQRKIDKPKAAAERKTTDTAATKQKDKPVNRKDKEKSKDKMPAGVHDPTKTGSGVYNVPNSTSPNAPDKNDPDKKVPNPAAPPTPDSNKSEIPK